MDVRKRWLSTCSGRWIMSRKFGWCLLQLAADFGAKLDMSVQPYPGACEPSQTGKPVRLCLLTYGIHAIDSTKRHPSDIHTQDRGRCEDGKLLKRL